MAETSVTTVEEQESTEKTQKDSTTEIVKEQEDLSPWPVDYICHKNIPRIISLGLGRGVDATEPNPWQNKTSFQVRPVTTGNIVETEEGGSVQSYVREISSASESQVKASASVTDPKTAVTIGVEAEYSQSSSKRHRIIGTKVLNRTISFKDHIYDDANIQQLPDSTTFEAWLCNWILMKNADKKQKQHPKSKDKKELDQKQSLTEVEGQPSMMEISQKVEQSLDTSAVENMSLAKMTQSRKFLVDTFRQHCIKREELSRYCTQFVVDFRITHYVSSIQLGASGYEVVSESKIARKLGLGGRAGVEKIAATSGSAKVSHSKSESRHSSNVKRIGVIELKDGIPTVRRGTYQEAVVGVQVKPISELILIRELRKSLQKSLVEYTRKEEDTHGE